MNIAFQKDKPKNNWFQDKFKALGQKIKNFKIPTTFYYFLILVAIGIGFYLWMLAENDFTLAYGGDFSAQYIPMGYHVWDYYHDWIRTGHFNLFDSTLYLGANSIGSNAYYGLFSPFNIIIVLLPRSFVPHSIAICSIVKLACAGLFFNFFMVKAFNVKDYVGRLCGVAYAFCGWGAFYLWYNNYQDILVFLPLVLWGIELTIKEQKPWLLALGVFFITVCNYVLMVPYIICAFFYAMFRFFQQITKKTVKDNFIILGLGVLGFAGGLLMSMFVFLPAFMATMSSPKLDTNSYGGMLKEYLFNKDFGNFFKLLFSWKEAPDQHGYIIPVRVYYPILEFFFPATTCRSLPTNEFSGWDFDDMAVSLWCYIPFIMFLVPALIQSGKEKKWSHYIGFALLTLSIFTPFMYYLTMGLTNGYARWTLFIVACLIIYVGLYIDKIPNVAKWHIHVGYTFAVLGIVAAWLLCYKLEGSYVYTKGADKLVESNRFYTFRFIEEGNNFTNIAYISELIYTTVVYLVLFFTFNKKAFNILITVFVSAEAIAMGNFVTLGHGWDTSYNNGYAENERFKKVISKVQEQDNSYYRVYTSIGDAYSTNNSFVNNYNSVGFFHSLYNFEIDDFTLWMGLRDGTKSVAGDYRGKYQDLDNLLGVKYYFISKNKSKYYSIEANNPNGYMANVPFDFERNEELEDKNTDYLVYENKNLGGFGYSYSHVYDNLYNETCGKNTDGEITVKYSYSNSDMNIRHAIMMSKAAMLTKEDAAEVTDNPDIILDDIKPDTTSLKYLYSGIDYVTDFYDISTVYNELGIGAAKDYPFNKIASIPTDLIGAKTDYQRSRPDNPDWSKAMDYFAFYHNQIESQPLFKAGTALYADAHFSGSQKYNFYFIDMDNNIFMFDAHDDDTTDNTSDIRGFYIKKDVKYMALVGKYYQSYFKTSYGSDEITLSAEKFEDYEARRNDLNANPIENVTYEPDKFTFETHYTDQARFVISRVAFDKGWTIKAKDSEGNTFDVKTYKGNGGFVSFIAPKGNITYTMTYKTPYLNGGLVISALTFTAFFVSMLAYYLYQEKKKNKYLDKIFREN